MQGERGENKLRLTLRRCHWQRMGEIKEQDIWKDRYRGKCYRGSDTVPDITSCKKQYDYGFSKSNF